MHFNLEKLTQNSITQMQRIMHAHIFFEMEPQLFLYFWGVLDMENTVPLFKKSKWSISFDADPIFRAVTVHA